MPPMGQIDYTDFSDRDLLIALNRKMDAMGGTLKRAEDLLTDTMREFVPMVEGMKSGGVAGLMRALF